MKSAVRNVFRLSGRRDGKSYLTFQVCTVVVLVAFIVVATTTSDFGISLLRWTLIAIFATFLLTAVVGSLTTGAQRCRDIGWSGWCILIGLLPFLGTLFMVVLCVVPGTSGRNAYGPDPREDSIMEREEAKTKFGFGLLWRGALVALAAVISLVVRHQMLSSYNVTPQLTAQEQTAIMDVLRKGAECLHLKEHEGGAIALADLERAGKHCPDTTAPDGSR